jgi:hypothetical protein
MDPNATLQEMRSLMGLDPMMPWESARLAELVEAMDGWLSAGGFLPEAWRRAYGRPHIMAQHAGWPDMGRSS